MSLGKFFGVVLGFKNAEFKRGMKESRSEVDAFKGACGKIGGAIAGIGLVSMSKQVLDYAGNLQDSADALSLNVEELQGLRAAFSESGTSAEGFDKSMTKLVQKIEDAKGGNDAALASFAELGISLDELKSKTPGEVLMMMADGFERANGSGAALSATIEILGKNGMTMAAGMKEGADGIKELAEQAAKLTTEQIAGLDAMGDAAGRAWNKILTLGAKALGGVAVIWDATLGSILESFGIDAKTGIEKAMTTPDPLKQVKTSADRKTTAAEQAAIDKNSAEANAQLAKLKEQELSNARALMSAQERLVSLERERAELLKKVAGAGTTEGLRLRTEAAKMQGEINRTKKEISDSETAAAEKRKKEDEKRKKEAEEIAENIARKKKEIDGQEKELREDVANAKQERTDALNQISVQKSAGKLDSLLQRARMSPAERRAAEQAVKEEQKANERGEKAFIGEYERDALKRFPNLSGQAREKALEAARIRGRAELQRIKDMRDPAKQAEAAFKAAIADLQKEGTPLATIASNTGEIKTGLTKLAIKP